jgi:hypothetical protein
MRRWQMREARLTRLRLRLSLRLRVHLNRLHLTVNTLTAIQQMPRQLTQAPRRRSSRLTETQLQLWATHNVTRK